MAKLNIEEIIGMKVDVNIVQEVFSAIHNCNYKEKLLDIRDRFSSEVYITEVIDELIRTDQSILNVLYWFGIDIISCKSGDIPVVEFRNGYNMLKALNSFCRESELYKTMNILTLAMQIIDISSQYEKILHTAREMDILAIEEVTSKTKTEEG